MAKDAQQIRRDLNRSNRAAANAVLGNVVYDLINAVNALTADVAALRTKLDADAGVTDTTYVSLGALPAVVKLPEAR
jgi:hypothetical protein